MTSITEPISGALYCNDSAAPFPDDTMSSASPTPDALDKNHVRELEEFISELNPDREPVASELGVLQSIYGDEAVRLWHTSGSGDVHNLGHVQKASPIRYEVHLSLPVPHEDVFIKVLVSVPATYPALSPPQLQLISRYIGAFGVDSQLFGSVLRTYISANGIQWSPDIVCVFDGLQSVTERATAWYEERLSIEKAGELLREGEKVHEQAKATITVDRSEREAVPSVPTPSALPEGVDMAIAEPIIERKSIFVGRACRISDPSQVPLILSHLMSDRRIARAAHPVINAWRCMVDTVLHQDNDDDGETAAGGRLAHLLQILEVHNVIVIVTRYFGGIHLGPDRFKHINQAARNALEIGGFLDDGAKKNVAGGRARKR